MYVLLPTSIQKEKLPLYPLTLGVRRLQKYISRPRGAEYHHVLFVSEGEGVFIFNGEKKIIKAGNAVFIRKNYPVDYGTSRGIFKTSWVIFDGHAGDELLEYFSAPDYEILSYVDIESKIAEMYALAKRGASLEALSAKTYSLIMDFFLSLRKTNGQPILEKAKHYIDVNFKKDLSVEEISSKMGISQSLLFRLFREDENMTPMEYLKRARMRQACEMLLFGDKKISEIAIECGFSDSSYFCKVFKENVGMTPASYRQKTL